MRSETASLSVWPVVPVWFAAFVAFAWAALRIPVPETGLLVFWGAWAGACFGIALVFFLSRGRDDTGTLLKLVGGGMAVDLLCNTWAQRLYNELVRLPELAQSAPSWLWLCIPLYACGNLGMLSAAIGIGHLVTRGMKRAAYLVVAVAAGAASDLISVFAGPSKATLNSDFFPYVAYHWGLPGRAEILPIIGAGDFIFLAIYFVGARRFRLDTRRSLTAMFAAFGAGFLVSVFYELALPALPFMAVSFLAAHRRELRRLLTTDE